MKVCVGGTFNILHKGHEVLFEKAFKHGTHVYIGLTSDVLVKEHKEIEIDDFGTRKKRLESFLRNKGWDGRFSLVQLDDELGPAVREDYDVIVVSEETKPRAQEINKKREKNSLKPLEIITINMVYAENGEMISSTKIKKGEMNENGRMLRKVVVCVGSENQVKINAVKNVFSKLFKEVEVNAVKVQKKVPEQPMEKEVIEGAMQRAKAVMDQDCDFGVGIEAGLFWNDVAKKYFDVQYCAVIDKGKRMTLGHGSGFCYPEKIIELVKQGKTVSQSIEKRYGVKDVGRKMGAIGYLSEGILDRTRLTEQAVFMAMVPRIRRELYEG